MKQTKRELHTFALLNNTLSQWFRVAQPCRSDRGVSNLRIKWANLTSLEWVILVGNSLEFSPPLVRQRCQVRYFFFTSYDLEWSTARGSVSMLQVGGQSTSVYPSPAEIWLFLSKRKRCMFNNCGVILTLIIHWLDPPLFLPWCSEAMLPSWSERLAKGPYQRNTPPIVICRLQIQGF